MVNIRDGAGGAVVVATPTSVDFQAVKAISKKATLFLTILLQFCNNIAGGDHDWDGT